MSPEDGPAGRAPSPQAIVKLTLMSIHRKYFVNCIVALLALDPELRAGPALHSGSRMGPVAFLELKWPAFKLSIAARWKSARTTDMGVRCTLTVRGRDAGAASLDDLRFRKPCSTAVKSAYRPYSSLRAMVRLSSTPRTP